jgi:hypothetical protein
MGKNPATLPPLPGTGNILHRRASVLGFDSITEPEIAQTYAWEATGIVWTGAKGTGSFNHPGHAALALRKVMNPTPNFAIEVDFKYVSYIPGSDNWNARGVRTGFFTRSYEYDIDYELGTAEGRLRTRQFRASPNQVIARVTPSPGQLRGGEQLYEEKWGKVADRFVSMQAFSPASIGIDMNRIVSWCVKFRNSTDYYYDFVSNTHNCASVAWRALDQGGGRAYCQIQDSVPNHKIYITPKEFGDYSVSVAEGVLKADRALNYVINTAVQKLNRNAQAFYTAAPIGFGGANDLYQTRDWMNESAVAWKMRGWILRRIDDAIQKYHTYTWDRNYSEKLFQLLTVTVNLQDHFRASSSGSRDAALTALAIQVMSVFAQLRADATIAWDAADYYEESPDEAALQRAGDRNKKQDKIEGLAF